MGASAALAAYRAGRFGDVPPNPFRLSNRRSGPRGVRNGQFCEFCGTGPRCIVCGRGEPDNWNAPDFNPFNTH